MSKPRVRFAPSPTGPLHLGTARTALFNYLFAKKTGGDFILRIEDTDVERSKKEFEEEIIESLRWLGISWQEGPDVGGPFGPYRQSERKEIYKKYLKKLIAEKKAYFCFCTPEEVEAYKQYRISIGEPPVYGGKCAQLTEEEVRKNLESGKKFVIRLRVPLKQVHFDDIVRGRVEFESKLLGDIVIAKDFETPLYNFACVVDDYEMKISHVIRGEDHISNTPKQILIQEALGFPKVHYAHLPLILGPDRSKLSKRHGAKSILELKKEGYLPEAIFHFLALLGWTPPQEKDFFEKEELIENFSLEKVHKSPAVFNVTKLDYLNSVYLRHCPLERLAQLSIPYLVEADLVQPILEAKELIPGISGSEVFLKFRVKETLEEINLEEIKKIVALFQERMKKISELPSLADFFFKKELEIEKSLFFWKDQKEREVREALEIAEKILEKIEPENFKKENLLAILTRESENFSLKIRKKIDRGYFLWPLRVALSGREASPPPFDILEILGKEKSLARIRKAKTLFKKFGIL